MTSPTRKKSRKSRSRGLRTNTGCLTCRKRHKKCDEQLPVCGSCQLANRTCVYGDPSLRDDPRTGTPPRRPSTVTATVAAAVAAATGPGAGAGALFFASADPTPGLGQPSVLSVESASGGPVGNSPHGSNREIDDSTTTGVYANTSDVLAIAAPTPSAATAAAAPLFTSSPGNLSIASDILLTSGGASIGWLDLLASDAAQADASFSLMLSRRTSFSERIPYVEDGDDAPATVEQQLTEEDARMSQRQYLQQQYQLYLDQQQHEQQQRQQEQEQQKEQQRRQQQELQVPLQQTQQTQQAQQTQQSQQPRQTQQTQQTQTYSVQPGNPRQLSVDSNKCPWQETMDIVLMDHEKLLFRSFVEHASSWLDFLDLEKYFSSYAIRLALRNLGLMKAILALSARHTAMSQHAPTPSPSTDAPKITAESRQPHTAQSPVRSAATVVSHVHSFAQLQPSSTADDRGPDVHAQHSQAIQYYYETLHYLQHALQFPSYTMSEEILATAIIISTYEMLDQSASNWQRHLKGVFWIQRSQDVNGASGGLRQAVWWAWLRQDIWAAFRERRSCFSFWKPEDSSTKTTDPVNMAVYLLSQAVNFAAQVQAATTTTMATTTTGSEPDTAASSPVAGTPTTEERQRAAGEQLLAALEQWKTNLGPEFQPLPKLAWAETADCPFEPIWIHPPRHAVAVMVYHFAKIVVTLHCPLGVALSAGNDGGTGGLSGFGGFTRYLKIQKILSDAVAAIGGIALLLEDEGCQIMVSQCLYGAGLCVQQPAERAAILDLLRACERRTGWPMATMRRELEAEWERV